MRKDTIPAELQALPTKLESEIRPLLRQSKYDHPPGYDCCGCDTYDEILDHAIRIVRDALEMQTKRRTG